MKFVISFLFSLLITTTYSQVELDLLGHIDFNQQHNTDLNDIWGYVDEFGNEYALVGARKGVSIVDVTDPMNPNEVYWHDDSPSIWRDLKTWGDYAYVTTEASSGLLIMDLSPLPGGSITSIDYFFGQPGLTWSSAHNLFIDENGFCYIFGSNRGNGGVIIYDLSDPMNPVEVGAFDNWYVHDGYVRGNLMYLAHIYEGMFSIVDVTDKANPVLLGTQNTTSNFTHNIWLSDNGNHVFTTDELSDSYIEAYDVSDPANIFLTDKIQSNPGTGTVPHNTHVLGDFIVTSYYADGITVHDISDPNNIIEVGNYDTHPGTSTSTTGCWGAYPFLPSGNLLASDISTGFYVIGPNYDTAGRLEGTIDNSVTLLPVDNVLIQIQGDNQSEYSDVIGGYQTGFFQSGTVDVNYSKYGYLPQTIAIELFNDSIVQQNVSLVPIPTFSVIVEVVDENNLPILNSLVRLTHQGEIIELSTNGLGQAQFELFYIDNYDLNVGKWGYSSHCENLLIDNNTGTLIVQINQGYFDDFTFDYGWSTFGDADNGLWERAIPVYVEIGGGVSSNPSEDSPNDCGEMAYVTGNGPISADNVNNGTVTLVSPVFDLTSYSDPFIYFERWFFCFLGQSTPDDTMRVILSNGLEMVEIDKVGSNIQLVETWYPVTTRVSDFLDPTSTMQLFISISDLEPNSNATEGGFDNFSVNEGPFLNLSENKQVDWVIYPNPIDDFIYVHGITQNEQYFLYDSKGQIVKSDIINENDNKVNCTNLHQGIYLFQIGEDYFKIIK